MLFSHLKLSCVCTKAHAHPVFHWCLYNNIDGVYNFYDFIHLVISQQRSSSRRNSCDSTEDNEEPEKAVVDSKVFFELCYFNLITSSFKDNENN